MQIIEDFSYFEVHRHLLKKRSKYLPKTMPAATFREKQLWSVNLENQGE